MIRSIDKIDDVKMEFSVQITFRWGLIFDLRVTFFKTVLLLRQKWFDDRLQFAHKVSPTMKDKIKYLTITEPGKVSQLHINKSWKKISVFQFIDGLCMICYISSRTLSAYIQYSPFQSKLFEDSV